MGSHLLLALLVFEVRLTSVRGYLQLEGVVGENVSISAKVPSDFNVTGVIWRHLSSTEKLVVMFFKGDAETTYQSRFFGRARLLPNFTLEIDNLELGDSGTFKALLMDSTGRIETNIVVLTVYEMVNKPRVEVFASRVEANRSSNSNSSCDVFLTCTVDKGTAVSYIWRRTDHEHGTLNNATHSIFESGRILRVRLHPSQEHMAYSCTAFNPVSQEATSVRPWDGCNSKPGAEGSIHENKYFLCIVLPLLIVLVSAIMFWTTRFLKCTGKKKKKGDDAGGEAEELAV
ncbi:SLAM family member 8-like [Lissotriton helveticus]